MLSSVGARVASVLVVCLATAVVVYDRPLTPFDASLPIVAAALFVFAWVGGIESLEIGPIALIVSAIAMPNDSIRLLACGAIAAVAFATAVVSASRDGSLERFDAISLALTATALFRLIPIEGRRFLPELVVFLGVAALVVASSFRGRVALDAFSAVLLVGILTPADPSRAALLPLLLAAACWFVRGGGLLALLAAVPIAVAAGRWAIPILVAAVALRLPLLRRGSSTHDDSFLWMTRCVISAGLVAVGLFTRPILAVLYFATALVFCFNRKENSPFAVPLLGYLSIAALAVAWSGVLAPAFPLPVTPLQLTAIAAILLLTAIPPRRWIGIPAAALFLVALLVFAPRFPNLQPVEVSLAPGDSFDIRTRPFRVVDLVLSGANISDLERGAVVGTIEVLTEHGAGLHRDVRVGDLADWGAFREGHHFHTRNPRPLRISAVSGWGAEAYPSGAGMITLVADEKIASIRVTAHRTLPPNARLQVESFEER